MNVNLSQMLNHLMRGVQTFLFVCVVFALMSSEGCSATEEEKRNAYNLGYEKGHQVGYDAGLAYGRQLGSAEGHRGGIADGIKIGRKEGLEEGLKQGRREGYLQGSMVFVEGTWIPSLGLALTALLTIFTFSMLRLLFANYREAIKERYAHRMEKAKLNSDIIGLYKDIELIPYGNYKEQTIELLQRTKRELTVLRKEKLDVDLQVAGGKMSAENTKELSQCIDKLNEAQTLINQVLLAVKVTSRNNRFKSIREVLKIFDRNPNLPELLKLQLKQSLLAMKAPHQVTESFLQTEPLGAINYEIKSQEKKNWLTRFFKRIKK